MRTLEERDMTAREANHFVYGLMTGVVATAVTLAFLAKFAINWHALCQIIH